jgi:Spy/CpxP family protein refolding chaperone
MANPRGTNPIYPAMIAVSAISLAMPAVASGAPGHAYRSKYAGEEKREIKSLSSDDIRELTEGGGWGLAKAAELNGLPGPKHILEMKNEINLTEDQEARVKLIYREMNAKAVELGEVLIAHERELNSLFANRNMDEQTLEDLLGRISETYKMLRFTHLAAHLKMLDILRDEQIEQYNKLRGYFADDPCANIPEGHDPVMWRRHNNCD